MSIRGTSGSTVARPRLFRTVMTETINGINAEDRYPNSGEVSQLDQFFGDGQRRVAIVAKLTENAEMIVSRAANRIFVGGSPMAYSERQKAKAKSPLANDEFGNEPIVEDRGGFLESLKSIFSTRGGGGRASADFAVPPDFEPINIARYGPERMQKSIRDLDWFLRYTTYAILAGDPSILEANCLGLREILEKSCSISATIVALLEMRKNAARLFKDEADSKLVSSYISVVIRALDADRSDAPADIVRPSSEDRPGLTLPYIYKLSADSLTTFKMTAIYGADGRPRVNLSSDEKERVVRAAYRQVFERDLKAYGQSVSEAESKVKNGEISVREFVRRLGKSELYRREFYQPFINSRVLELAFKHFLGRAPESRAEVQKYFSIISSPIVRGQSSMPSGGLYALIDALIDSEEYTSLFGEDTVPYLRNLGVEAQPSWNWGAAYDLYNYAAPRRKVPQFITLFADYTQPLPNQHPYGAGNDPLEIQFGAIFKNSTINPAERAAPIGKDVKRILIRNGNPTSNERGNPTGMSEGATTLGPKIFKLTQNVGFRSKGMVQNAGVVTVEGSVQALITAAYQQVFGRQLYQGQRLKVAEIKLENGETTVKEFVRALARSEVFRKLYWEPFYVCKAIEYIHRRLLGRPTYDRVENNRYFDIASKKGFYGVVDAMLNSSEYQEVFGEDVLPYERYLTPAGLSLRKGRFGSSDVLTTPGGITPRADAARMMDKIQELGTPISERSIPEMYVNQGVPALKRQRKVFKQSQATDRESFDALVTAAYVQVFDKDIASYIRSEFSVLESRLRNRETSVKEFVRLLGFSELYRKQFHDRYPNTKVVEFAFKHFLGRAVKNQAELIKYHGLLGRKGIKALVGALVDSEEYGRLYGEDTVPSWQFPTLPAANYPNSVELYNRFTRQDDSLVVPSFKPIRAKMDIAAMPLVQAALKEQQTAKTALDMSKPMFLELGRSFKGTDGQSVEVGVGTLRRQLEHIYRIAPDTTRSEKDVAINAIYRQVLDVFAGIPPSYLRLSEAESKLKNNEISVREFVRRLGRSENYRKRFFEPYSSPKVVELLTKHFLGRAPISQQEISTYVQILGTKGLAAAVDAIVESPEYLTVFNEDIVPYRRYPTLPAGNYRASVRVNDEELISQSWSSLSPTYTGYQYVTR
ncbi:MAG: phycobilisome rod-core linker polypeptide [Aphanocapsa lilacina HA4352-LM1]|nr:phycobilisome rod-core linker polypeptide [Aphanocapsa lilacina HA4352-LM1]